MKFKHNLPLLIKYCYSYDIVACHYSILKSLGINVKNINFNDKIQRNIQIGYMMKSNPRLKTIIRNITNSLINEYININKIKNDDIILRQYDGIITKKMLTVTTDEYNIPLPLRHKFEVFLISINKQSYLAYDGNEIKIKGVTHRYNEMDKILKKIIKCNFANRSQTFKLLQQIKDDFINSKNPKLFLIPLNDNKNSTLFLKGYNQVSISSSMYRFIDTDEIDKQVYFDNYIKPFTQSISYELLKNK